MASYLHVQYEYGCIITPWGWQDGDAAFCQITLNTHYWRNMGERVFSENDVAFSLTPSSVYRQRSPATYRRRQRRCERYFRARCARLCDTTIRLLVYWYCSWRRHGVVVGSLVSINEVNLRWARSVGWVTVSRFDSRRRHFISVCNQPSRSTQPSTLRGTVKWVPAKGRWCSAAGE